jgi:hypothetical protein
LESQNGPAAGAKSGMFNMTFMIIVLAIIVVVLGAFVLYYFSASGQISTKNSQISGLNARVLVLETQVVSDNAQINALLAQVGTSGQTGNNQALQLQVNSLKDQLVAANSEITSLQNQVKEAAAQTSSLQTQLTAANARLSSFQNLSESTTPANAVLINQPAAQEVSVTTFSAAYAGYVMVTASNYISGSYIRVTDSYGSYPLNDYNYYLNSNGSVIVPVLPGFIGVYIGNNSFIGGGTATITVKYYY